jgi:hypothetical protein
LTAIVRPKPLEIDAQKVATDFFGRAVVSKPIDTNMDDATGILWYNSNELRVFNS